MSDKMKTGLPANPNDEIDYTGVELKEIYLAGGCFWGGEAWMRRIKGVADTEVGYANGTKDNPTYEEVCTGTTGHAECVRVRFAPSVITTAGVLEAFFETIEHERVMAPDGQYRNGVYYNDEEIAADVNAFIEGMKEYGAKIGLQVCPLTVFWAAEDYHQDYLEKNPGGFCHVDLSRLDSRK